MAQQIKFLLTTVAWPTGGTVFGGKGSVAVYAGAPTQEQIPIGFPWALVGIDGGEHDDEHPDWIMGRFSVTVGAQSLGDRMGEFAVIGGGVGGNSGANRGVLEVSAIARASVQQLTGADGAAVTLSGSSMSPPASIGIGKHLCMEKFDLTALCTSRASYESPQRLRFSGSRWRWDGDQCSNRFDFISFTILKKTGANPSATLTDGTVVYTGTAAEWAGTQEGNACYTCFAGYGSRGAIEAYSPVVVGSYRQPT